jgi:hypothetical protein
MTAKKIVRWHFGKQHQLTTANHLLNNRQLLWRQRLQGLCFWNWRRHFLISARDDDGALFLDVLPDLL